MELPGEKLMIKLWETLSEKAIGGWLRPGQQRREGLVGLELKRAELLTLAQAARDVEEINSGTKSLSDFNLQLKFSSAKSLTGLAERVEPTLDIVDLIEQSNNRTALDSIRKEINVAKAILHAEEKIHTENDDSATDEKVNDDWVYRWRDYAGDVSSEDMQRLWGSLLAGEVKAPGTYSLRCMEFLRNLEQSEAKLIEVACQLTVDGLVLLDENLDSHLSFNQLLELDTLGIISGVSGGGVRRTFSSEDGAPWSRTVLANNKCLLINHPQQNASVVISGYILTNLGHQMLSLGNFKSDVEYLKDFGRKLITQGARVYIADYDMRGNDTINYYNTFEVK
jgi:hypothetical protein